jgi:hypothetical protein
MLGPDQERPRRRRRLPQSRQRTGKCRRGGARDQRFRRGDKPQARSGRSLVRPGTTLTHMRRFESAIADFTEAIRLKPDFALAYAIAAWRISSSAITTKPWSTIQSRSTAIPSSLIAISIAAACTSLGRLPEGDQRSRRGPGPETRRSHRPDQARTSLRGARPEGAGAGRFPRGARCRCRAQEREGGLCPHHDGTTAVGAVEIAPW